MNDQQGIISLSEVRFSYEGRKRQLFEGMSLEIPPGTITAVLGPNGSGKTTLLHLILGILSPSDGTVLIAHRPRHHYSRREFGQLVGLVSQDEYIPFDFTVLEYVLMGRAPRLHLLETPSPEDYEVARRAVETLELTPLTSRSIQSLSGGERQLVMVARALAQEPRILLLDEPTSHLDLANTHRILEVLQRLRAAGQTVLFSTHDPNSAAAVADYVILLREGAVQTAGRTAEVLTSEHLSATYGVPVEVVPLRDRLFVVAPTGDPERVVLPV